MIELACPHCGIGQRLDDALAGQRVNCHSCGKGFKVPQTLGSKGSSGSKTAAGADFELSEPVLGPVSESRWRTESSSPPTKNEWSKPESAKPESAKPESAKPETASAPLPFDPPIVAPPVVAPLSLDHLADPLEGLFNDDLLTSTSPKPSKQSAEIPPDAIRLEGAPLASTDEIRVRCKVCDSVIWVKPHKIGTYITCTDCTSSILVTPDTSLPAGPTGTTREGATTKPSNSAGAPGEFEPFVEGEKAKKLAEVAKNNPILQTARPRRWGEKAAEPTPHEIATADVRAELHAGTPSATDRGAKNDKPRESVKANEQDRARDRQIGTADDESSFTDWLRLLFIPFKSPELVGAVMLCTLVFYFHDLALQALVATEGNFLLKLILWGVYGLTLIASWTSMAIVGGATSSDTASGSDTIENWPSITPLEFAGTVSGYVVPLAAASVPGLFIAQLAIGMSIPMSVSLWFLVLLRAPLLVVVFLSVMNTGSMFGIFSPQVVKSYPLDPKAWNKTLAAVMICSLIVALSSCLTLLFGWCMGALMAPLSAIAWIVQFRAIGLLGRRVSELVD